MNDYMKEKYPELEGKVLFGDYLFVEPEIELTKKQILETMDDQPGEIRRFTGQVRILMIGTGCSEKLREHIQVGEFATVHMKKVDFNPKTEFVHPNKPHEPPKLVDNPNHQLFTFKKQEDLEADTPLTALIEEWQILAN